MRVAVILGVLLLAGCTMQPNEAEMPSTSTGAGATSSSAGSTTQAPLAGEVRVTMVDVGQGMSVLLEFPDGVALVDAANRFSSSTNALLAALHERGITTVDHVAVTNPDADHAGGCNEVAQQFVVRHFYHPGNPKDTQTWADCLAAMEAEGAAIHRDAAAADEAGDDLDEGELLPWSQHATVQLLNADSESSTVNAGSLALLVRVGATGILFSGDMDCDAEQAVLARGYDLDVDLLQAGHHGSKTSSCAPWLDATSPRDVLIAVGTNSYGHPTSEALTRFADAGATVYRTDLNGDIMVTISSIGYVVSTGK